MKRKRTDWGPYASAVGGSHIRMPPTKSGMHAFLGGSSSLNNLIKGTDRMANIPTSAGFGGIQKIMSEGVAFNNDTFTLDWENGIIGFAVAGIATDAPLSELTGCIIYIDFSPMRIAGFDGFYTDESPTVTAARIQQELAYAISIQFNKTYPRFQYVPGQGDTFSTQTILVDAYPSPLVRTGVAGYPIIVSVTGSGQLCFRTNFEAGYENDPAFPETNYYFNIFTPSSEFFEMAGRNNQGKRVGLNGRGWVGLGAHVFGFGKKDASSGKYYDEYTFPGGARPRPTSLFNDISPPFTTSDLAVKQRMYNWGFRQFVCGHMPAKVIPSRYYLILSEELTAKQRMPGIITNVNISDVSQAIGVHMNRVGYGNSRERMPPFIRINAEFNPMYTTDSFSFDILDEYGNDVSTASETQYQEYNTRTYEYMQRYGNPTFNGGFTIPQLLEPNAANAGPLLQPDKFSNDTPFDYALMSNNPLIVARPDISELLAFPAITPLIQPVDLGDFITDLGTDNVPTWKMKPSSSRVLNFSAVGF